MTHHDAVVVGAGLAGLAAARELAIHGIDVQVFEAADAAGGRVRSDIVDGFTLDRGFQLYNPAYPEAARVLDHEALNLHPLTRGMDIVRSTSTGRAVLRLADPRSPGNWRTSALSRAAGTITGKARFAAYARAAAKLSGHQFDERADEPAQVALARAGIDATMIDHVIRPFLTGVFLEPHLMTSRRFMDVVLASFVKGTPSLPQAGMQAIPDQLHDALPDGTVHCESPVRRLTPASVETDSGTITASVVIVATDATHASALLEDAGLTTELNTATNSVTTWYHAVATTALPEPLARRRSVITVPDKRSGPVINTVPLTYAVPSYSPDGQILVSSSSLGVDDSAEVEQAVRGHLQFLYGADTSGWELVARYPIHGALPSMRGPLTVADSGEHGPVILAGDHCTTASIQGAMISGRHAADAAFRRLGIVRSDDRRIAV